ncbi:hypothetical protein KR093_004645 [Drosophila rubida]|uniref:Reticulon-like protein n=1 Tax=Drosophila rubida TaxID=30044 RepID=A0AAD4PM48_9MUSC|nr:hypothetical protein KR093_004645 [Drosophila rubida]
MDNNFAELKKEAAATAEDIFNAASKKVAGAYDDLLGDFSGDGNAGSAANVSSDGAQDDNAHTEHYFANEQKKVDFGLGDPQAFVQRMSAGAKEAQEQLDAKFAAAQQTTVDDFSDFLSQAGKSAKQGISDLTTDFMNMERGYFGDASAPATAPVPAPDPATATAPVTEPVPVVVPVTAAVPTAAPVPAPAAAAATVPVPAAIPEPQQDLLGGFSQPEAAVPLQPFEPSAPANSQFYDYDDDDDDLSASAVPVAVPAPVSVPVAAAAAAAVAIAANKDSDTDSPSVSYTTSPAKKPITDALKEQDNEKFISSEDLLSDFKEEPRIATPPVAVAAKAAALITDLDDDEVVAKPTVAIPSPVAAKAEPKVEPVKSVPKVEPPKVKTPAADQQQQPKIVSVEEIFYKYGLDAWFKPERLHPQVESLIYWRDVKKSGIVFGAGLVTLVAISSFSVISVFAYLSLLALFGTVAFRIYKSVTQAVQKTNDGHPFKEYLELDLTLSQEKVQHIAGVAVAHLNGFTAELRRLFLVEDLIDSIKFGVILWVFTYIGAWFNGMTLVILAFVSLFTLPKVYENNKQSIDTYLDLVRTKLTEITDKIRVAIPIGNKKPVAATESDKDK